MGAEKLDEDSKEYTYLMPELIEKSSLSDVSEKFSANLTTFILDFRNSTNVNRSFFPILHQFKARLEKENIEMISINIGRKLKNQLASDGVLRMFNFSEESSTTINKPKKGIDVEFLSPFINATTEILKVQANIESKSGKPRIKQKDERSVFDIVGIISLVSQSFEGSISLCFKESVFLGICESMLGEPYTEINDEIEDAAGELLNIIFGVAKAELNDNKNYKLEKAIPTIVRGPGMRIKQTVGPTIILPFETSVGNFQIEIEAVDY